MEEVEDRSKVLDWLASEPTRIEKPETQTSTQKQQQNTSPPTQNANSTSGLRNQQQQQQKDIALKQSEQIEEKERPKIDLSVRPKIVKKEVAAPTVKDFLKIEKEKLIRKLEEENLSEKDIKRLSDIKRLKERREELERLKVPLKLKELRVPLVRLEDMDLDKERKEYEKKQQKKVKFPAEDEAIAEDQEGHKYRLSKSFEKTGEGFRHKRLEKERHKLSLEDISQDQVVDRTESEVQREQKLKEVERKTSSRIRDKKLKQLQDEMKGLVKESDYVYDYGDRKKKKMNIFPKLVNIRILKRQDKQEIKGSEEFKQKERNASEMREIREIDNKLNRTQEKEVKQARR